jgi:hypothetical protein
MLTEDSIKFWLVWILRTLVPLLVLTLYVQRKLGFDKASRSDVKQLNAKANSSSIKQHALLTESRPLFRIEESQNVILGPSPVSKKVRTSHYSRELLLAARKQRDAVAVSYLVGLRVGSAVQSRTHAMEKRTPSRDDREHLRSLLEFRAFKTSALKDASWEKWNREAHKILQGALSMGCWSVGAEVHEIMTTNGVLPDAKTFTLLIEIALESNEVHRANEFADLMLGAGFLLEESLASRVRNAKCAGGQWNKNAPVFVPKFSQAGVRH